ncbi:uncharacterized protein BT62DRAFT_1012198 [Guyanagaster necrorhizus]|uniref:AAA-ATPase-like domain-containing protein n=1 Tax=Guyanagaster necrorhizus TaxID=856835 RepID=A0A9P7VJA4_9AGAR|nr:uncharacterized protein BT62DRAFT_1012198 [Guyanagaster necrorhizus MCA 3950]KAG7440984.1 hypothetical protein BT62DRAFT_1012198 [Guyanagaster necrorhizus MCA 3950]
MGTGFAPDPLINPYSCDVWSLVAIDMTDEDVVEATFGFTVDEAVKDVHDDEYYCQLPVGDHAWILTGKVGHPSVARSETPAACVDIDQRASNVISRGLHYCRMVFRQRGLGRIRKFSLRYPCSFPSHSESSCCTSSPIKVSQGIFKTDCRESTLPSCSFTAYQDISSSPGVVVVLVLVRRPAGFGKTSFLAMAEFFYDVKHRNSPVTPSALSSTWIGHLLLTFDLAATCVSDFEKSLVEHVNTVLKRFLNKNQQELEITPKNISSYIYGDGIHSLPGVLNLARSRLWSVFVYIDNYNAPSLAAGDAAEINECLERFLVGPLSCYLHDFHSGLIMGTGDEPDPRVSMYHPHPNVWECIATDMTDHETIEVSFGFMPDEGTLACSRVIAAKADPLHTYRWDASDVRKHWVLWPRWRYFDLVNVVDYYTPPGPSISAMYD